MSMSKKDFIAVAGVIRHMLNTCETQDEPAIEAVALELCPTFGTINPAFDRGRFLAACSVEDSAAPAQDEREFLTGLLDELNDQPCTFFACPGPNVRPVAMATCGPHNAAWEVRERLIALGAPVPPEVPYDPEV